MPSPKSPFADGRGAARPNAGSDPIEILMPADEEAVRLQVVRARPTEGLLVRGRGGAVNARGEDRRGGRPRSPLKSSVTRAAFDAGKGTRRPLVRAEALG